MPLIGTLNDFAPNTTIVSSDVDQNFTDIKTAFNSSAVLTDVAKTITVGHTFTAAQNMAAGTVSAPGIYMNGDTDTGIYQPAANQWAVAVGAALVLLLTTAGAAVTGTLSSTGAFTVDAGGVTVTAGGVTVSAGTTAVQALTATTATFSSAAQATKFTATGTATRWFVAQGADPRFDLDGSRDWAMQTVDADGRFRIYDQTGSTERFTISTAGLVSVPGTLAVTGTSTLTGNVGIGGASSSAVALSITSTLSGGVTQAAASAAATFSSGTTTFGIGVDSKVVTAAAAFTMAEAAAYRARNPTKGSGSTITTAYGLYVESLTQGGTNYAIYTAGTTASQFGGDVEHGGHIRKSDATSSLNISGGTGTTNGSNLNLFGGSHANAGNFLFRSGSTDTMLLNGSGNLGIGTTDIEAWSASAFRAIQLGGRGFIAAPVGAGFQTAVGDNAYFDGSWKYRSTEGASYHLMQGGEHKLFVAASGTVDTAISWTTALTIANSGAATFANGVTVSSGTTAVQALTATTGTFSGNVTIGGTLSVTGTFSPSSLNLGTTTIQDFFTGTMSSVAFGTSGGWQKATGVSLSGVAVGDIVVVTSATLVSGTGYTENETVFKVRVTGANTVDVTAAETGTSWSSVVLDVNYFVIKL